MKLSALRVTALQKKHVCCSCVISYCCIITFLQIEVDDKPSVVMHYYYHHHYGLDLVALTTTELPVIMVPKNSTINLVFTLWRK